MKRIIKKYNLKMVVILFILTPILLWVFGDFPRRSILKEAISLLMLVAFSLMIGQLFLTRGYRARKKSLKVSNLLKIHKAIGYIFITVLLFHPFLIVLPRFFESGVEPIEAFWTIITSFNSLGVVLGIISWFLILALGITSFIRIKLPIHYKEWRALHGILTVLFISIASWHVLELGRHTNIAMSVFYLLIGSTGILLLLNTYFFTKPNIRDTNK